MRTRITIGDFSRASHLSVKTLHHYHQVGLLEPSEVDADNGYRYYSEEQIPIGELRNLLEPETPHPITHRTVPATPAIGIQQTVDRDDIFAWWQGALGELHATVRAHGLGATGPAGGLYASELFQHSRGQATVFIPTDGTVRPVGRVVPLTVPRAELAVALHHGSPSDIDLTYGELGAYVMKHEISVDGPLRENYLRGITETADTADWDTEIGWPIFRTHD